MAQRKEGTKTKQRIVGVIVFFVFVAAFFWAISDNGSGRRFERTNVSAALMPPAWWFHTDAQLDQVEKLRTSKMPLTFLVQINWVEICLRGVSSEV
jgi:hypothetical protein